MAGVKSLAVRGIRSFGPEENDEQRISFEKPLTLILGQNGCGKTTIIECLRYAITGQMPPGSRNECFVHDAKVNKSTEVNGQVKLKIVNAKDKQLEVTRSMRVTAMPKKKSKFQTLDSFLSVIDTNGKTTDISSRCADLDQLMHEELGVPKAILNSVIFCHQEDSSWPLDEGKKVKERFDEIFDSDKYSDCFDQLRKIRKEYTQNIKLLDQEVSYLQEKKEELDKKKLDVVNTETRISETELKVAELTQDLKPVTEKIDAIVTLQKNLVAFESKKEKFTVRSENAQKRQEELTKAIKTVFEGTVEELQDNIGNYASTLKTKQKDLDDSYKKNFSFNKDEEKIANEKSNNDLKYNKLILQESQNQERIDKRNKMIVDTAKMADIQMTEILTYDDAIKGINTLTEKVASLKKDLEDARVAADAEEKSLQSNVDESRVALSRHEQKISNKETEMIIVKKDIIKIEKELTDANKSKERLELLEKKMNTAEEEYQQISNELNPEECQKEINEDEKAKEEHEQELENLNKKIAILQKQTAKLKERDIIEDTLKQKEKQFLVLKNKHKVALTELLGSMPEQQYAMSVNKVESEVRVEVDDMKKKLNDKSKEMTKLETERKHVRDMLSDRRSVLTKAEDKMYKACGTASYDTTLAKFTTSMEKLQDEQSVLQSSMFLIAKYKSQLKDNNCCPLCNRGFEAETEVTDLISQLTTQVLNVPAKLEKVTEELQRTSAKKDDLLSLKSLNEKITNLKETDIPSLEKRLTEIDQKIKSTSEIVDELSMSLVEPEQKLQTAKQVQGDMPLLDRFIQEIDTTSKKMQALKTECEGMDSEMTLDDANAKQTDLLSKTKTLRERIKSAQQKLNAYNKRLQKAGENKNKFKEQMLTVQKKVQEIVNLQDKIKQLEENRERYIKEIKELEDGKAPLEEQLKEKENTKTESINKTRAALEVKRNYLIKISNAFDKVKGIEAEIKQHKERNIQREMGKIKEANDKLMERKKQVMADRDLLTKKIDSLKEELANQKIYKRDLEDNLSLRKAQDEIETCKKEIADITEKLSGMNMDSLNEKDELITKQTQVLREKAQNEGVLSELKERLKQLKNELKKAISKDIERLYREKNYELHVSRAIDKDIRDYSVALEKSLMEFHREKMDNINLIIKELWRKIYRGNDIDYIEIKTEGSMNVDSDRRKYDYRVVQSKNGAEIDMRGRCSSGQKVLACLIIRLALAETFSSRFGILALDEPTTNLDEDNVRSLCSALGEIVQERMTQNNFMFIIITHDKEFIESLGNIDKVSHYYEVSRNKEGKSRIKRIRFT